MISGQAFGAKLLFFKEGFLVLPRFCEESSEFGKGMLSFVYWTQWSIYNVVVRLACMDVTLWLLACLHIFKMKCRIIVRAAHLPQKIHKKAGRGTLCPFL